MTQPHPLFDPPTTIRPFTTTDADEFARQLGTDTPPPAEPPAEDDGQGGGGSQGLITVTTSIELPDGTRRSGSAEVPADVTQRQLAFTVAQTGVSALAHLGIIAAPQVGTAAVVEPCGAPGCNVCQAGRSGS